MTCAAQANCQNDNLCKALCRAELLAGGLTVCPVVEAARLCCYFLVGREAQDLMKVFAHSSMMGAHAYKAWAH